MPEKPCVKYIIPNELLRALRRKGVARQRRVDGRTFWQAVGLPVERPRGMSEEIPF